VITIIEQCTCRDTLNPTQLRFSERGRSIAANLSDTGLLIGFNDNKACYTFGSFDNDN